MISTGAPSVFWTSTMRVFEVGDITSFARAQEDRHLWPLLPPDVDVRLDLVEGGERLVHVDRVDVADVAPPANIANSKL